MVFGKREGGREGGREEMEGGRREGRGVILHVNSAGLYCTV